MRTKNILSIAALIICGLVCVNSVKAQTKTSDNVTVSIKFKPIQTIVVNPNQKTVNLVYKTKDHYASGVSETRNDHLEIFSTGGFEVKVSTDGDFTRKGGGTISADSVTVKADFGTGTDNGKFTFTEVALSTTPKTLITADKGGRALKYNVTYDNTAGANDAYINKYISEDSEKGESVYTAKVIYTIATN
jgi:hypothetical protein